ncbi:MAG: hypothetical protein ACT4OO_11920 [Nitrospiraceae bacterium]
MLETAVNARQRKGHRHRAMGRYGWRRAVEGLCWWIGASTACCGAALLFFPSLSSATHEADHRFTVEGFVCGPDGKASTDIQVLVKDTRLSYGQTIPTESDGYYKVTFHLHNDNLGDPLLVEARGEEKHLKVEFDPKDLETERKVQVNFGAGCEHDRGSPPRWVFYGIGGVAVATVGLIGVNYFRKLRKQARKHEKRQGKRKKS